MITDKGFKLPDFIIIGAMKSGTTSIHHILDHHEDVFIPPREVYFFDVDDIEQHGDFFIRTKGGWTFHDLDENFEAYLDWYRRFFEEAGPSQIIGEDTTTYLGSRKAPGRIARILPDAKLIAMLRDPVSRAYSHYWHNVSAGRATSNFDRTIRFQSGNYLARGLYLEQLRRYKSFIERGRLKVVLFEDFLADKQAVTDDLVEFLELEGKIDVAQIDTRQNASKAPLSLPLRLLGNRIYSALSTGHTTRNIPNMPGYDPRTVGKAGAGETSSSRFWEKMTGALPAWKYPPMGDHTRDFLEKYFRRENEGLSELIGQDVSRRWAYMA